MFRFYLDNTLIADPINWSDFTETIERDDTIKGLLPKYEIKLKFTGAGYGYIYSQFQSNGFCKLIELKIEEQCEDNAGYSPIFNGYIFVSDCIFNLNKCQVECAVVDDNFGARIYNNKNLKAKIDVGFSKNGIAITPATLTSMGIYSTPNLTLLTTVDTYSFKEALRYLIDFMSDGLVGFESDFLTEGDPFASPGWMYLVLGEELRLSNGTAPTISFQQLFEAVNKQYPISFTIIKVAGKPTIKIEDDAYFFNETNSISLRNIDDLKQSFSNEKLYSKILLGSETADYDAILGTFPLIRFLGFKNEEYQLQGECNIDRELDLRGEFIIDSNIIQRITDTDTSSDTYDDNIIIIESAYGTDSKMYENIVGANPYPYYYNGGLTNNKVAERYSFANDIAFYLGNNNQAFWATRTTSQDVLPGFSLISDPILFDNDSTPPNFDTLNLYNPANGRYTSNADGVYTFDASVSFAIGSTGVVDIGYAIAFQLYDSGNTLIDTFLTTIIPVQDVNVAEFTAIGSVAINVLSGYYVTCALYETTDFASLLLLEIQPDSYFRITASVTGGGVYENKNPSNYYISKFEFEQPLSKNKYDTLKLDLSKAILFDNSFSQKKGWIRKTVRKLSTGEMQWELVSNIENSN